MVSQLLTKLLTVRLTIVCTAALEKLMVSQLLTKLLTVRLTIVCTAALEKLMAAWLVKKIVAVCENDISSLPCQPEPVSNSSLRSSEKSIYDVSDLRRCTPVFAVSGHGSAPELL